MKAKVEASNPISASDQARYRVEQIMCNDLNGYGVKPDLVQVFTVAVKC